MTYFSTFLLALILFVLIVLWSLIEITLEYRKQRKFSSLKKIKNSALLNINTFIFLVKIMSGIF